MLLNTVLLLTDTETFFLSSEQDQLIGQMVDNVVALCVEFLNVEFLNAVMALELVSGILLVAHLAHNLDFWAVSLDVIV